MDLVPCRLQSPSAVVDTSVGTSATAKGVHAWGCAPAGSGVTPQEFVTLGIHYTREQGFSRGLFPSLRDTALVLGGSWCPLAPGPAARAVTACSGRCSWGASTRPVEAGARLRAPVVLHEGTEESGLGGPLSAAPETAIPSKAGVRPAET